MKTQLIFPNHEFFLHRQPFDVAIFNVRKKSRKNVKVKDFPLRKLN